jgi:O-antigen/teichoic acid export membrane protein
MISESNLSHKTGVHSLSHNAAFLAFSRLVEKGVRFAYLIILARFLGPDMLGLYNYGLAWYLIFLPLANWGLNQLLSIHLGRKPETAEDIVGATLFVRLSTTVLFAGCCYAIGLLSNDSALSRNVITILVFALIGRSLAMWGRACFIAVELSQYSAGLEIGFRILEVCCGIGYLWLGGGIIGLCIIHSGCWIAEGTLALYLVRKRLSFRKSFVPWSFARPYALEAFPIAVNIFLLIALSQSGFVVLKHLAVDQSALGFYSVAFQLIVNTVVVTEAIGQAALPILSRADDRGTGEQIVFLEAMLKICFFCAAVLVLFVIVYGSVVIGVFFGQEYLKAYNALIIFSITMIVYYALPFANEVLRAGLKCIPAAVNIGIALIANIIMSVFLVSKMGEKAPAIGLVVGASSALMFHLIVIHRKIGKIAWWRAVFKPMLSVLIAVTITWNLKQFGGVALGTGLLILCVFYSGLKMFSPQELGYFARAIPWSRKS